MGRADRRLGTGGNPDGAVPLFVIVIAAIFLRDERITINRLAGLAVGFVGVAILVGFDPAAVAAGDLAGEIALIGATLSYAAARFTPGGTSAASDR